MNKIKAEIVADSKNKFGNRLTTFILTFPRYILAEVNTHRMLSKNSASSRAIPFKKMVKAVQENPFIPLNWMKDHSGMQGSEYWENPHDIQTRVDEWLAARNSAITHAIILNESLNVTKQMANRLLEAFMYHTVICTGTEFENFFSLRCSEFADIHIQKLAYAMLEAYNESTPKQLNAGEWHIPYGDKFDKGQLYSLVEANHGFYSPILEHEEENTDPIEFANRYGKEINDLKIKIAIARCARVSYTVVGEEGKPDNYVNDIKLFDRLSSSGHYSPFEHVGRAMDKEEFTKLSLWHDEYVEYGVSGNFRGFIQYRKTMANENRKDARVVQK